MNLKNYSIFLIGSFILFPFSVPISFADSGNVQINSYNIMYTIENGNIESISLDPDFFQLIITMTTQNDGTVEINIPRAILDAKFETTDDIFFVLVDGFETDYIEKESDSTSRTLVIPFFDGDSIIEIIGTETQDQFDTKPQTEIPEWIKNNAGWWAEGLIGDSDFVSGIQYLISKGIMIIPPTSSGETSNQEIPEWIKNNAGWWAEGLIGDSDFVSGIQYLISKGIMTV